MDTSDPEIVFNENGECNHCTEFFEKAGTLWFPNEEGEKKLAAILEKVKNSGKNNTYDCILGLSGGVDSSYLALKVRDMGLRPLVVHIDAGWNSELAVANIEAIVKHCKYDLYTHVVDWEDMRDLQLAYLRSGVANQDVPQDHAFFATLYHLANRHGIRYVLSGGNLATESIFPDSWHGSAMDAINLKAIHKKFGEKKLVQYKTISFFEYYFWYPLVKKMRTIRPLDYMHYNKAEALDELKNSFGYKAYERKHGESQLTKFFQNYYLPEKFGYDKRRPHLSSMIVSEQIKRDEALDILKEHLYNPHELEDDITYFCKKLRISRNDFDDLMRQPNRTYSDFRNWNVYYKILKRVQGFVSKTTGKTIKIH
tara:strand:+ start:19973 stop:21076 length:1104 start_codon:yes stop_codon:yes gene_type:complete